MTSFRIWAVAAMMGALPFLAPTASVAQSGSLSQGDLSAAYGYAQNCRSVAVVVKSYGTASLSSGSLTNAADRQKAEELVQLSDVLMRTSGLFSETVGERLGYDKSRVESDFRAQSENTRARFQNASFETIADEFSECFQTIVVPLLNENN